MRCTLVMALLSMLACGVEALAAEDPAISDYFGFQGLEIVKIDRGAGPLVVADMNGDGLQDLVVVNNFASRIEIHYQRKNASPEDQINWTPRRVNDLPEHWRYRRELISVSHQVSAVIPFDFDRDGSLDLVYAGSQPAEIVFMRQEQPGVFAVTRRHPVRNLGANRNAFSIADVLDDARPELISLVAGKINIWPLRGDSLGQPLELGAGAPLAAAVIEDYDGDGRPDIAGISPDDAAPIRLWLGSAEGQLKKLGAQVRFEMPALREFEPVRLPGEPAARIAVIERASKRMVLYEVATEPIETSGDRDAALSIVSFTDPGNRKRSTAVVDVDGDGLTDLLCTDTESNSLALYRQVKNKGMASGVKYPSLSDIDVVVAGNADADPQAEVFVLSEKESVVGVSHAGPSGIPFPQPLSIPDGHTPVAMNLVRLQDAAGQSSPCLAVVAKTNREYFAYIIDMKGERQAIALGSQSRSPETILAIDADQDGRTDLLLLTRDRPMTMLQAADEGFKVLESKDMGQFGLVQAARAINTAVKDIDGDGKPELLVAEKNYVRAMRYETHPATGVSPGWQVVQQINANDSSTKFVSITLLGDRIVGGDKENNRLIVMGAAGEEAAPRGAASNAGTARTWKQLETLNVRGFAFNAIHAGSFTGDGVENILAIGDDGFAVISLGGRRTSLKQFAGWRTDQERRVQHELTAGDVNGDGFTDLISLDAGEQMLEIFTFSQAHALLYASGFKVFESRMFTRGEPREFEPSQCVIADVTNDGAADVLLVAHDRILIYPQMIKPVTPSPRP